MDGQLMYISCYLHWFGLDTAAAFIMIFAEIGDMHNQDFMRFELKLGFGWIAHVVMIVGLLNGLETKILSVMISHGNGLECH